jgi:hypothetical protein
MVRLFSVSILAMLAGLASANSPAAQEVMNQPVHTMEGWSWADCGETYLIEAHKSYAKFFQAPQQMSFS